MATELVFDLETVPDDAIPFEPRKPDDFPPLACHRVVSCGTFTFAHGFQLLGAPHGDAQSERLILEHLRDKLENATAESARLVGWNSRRFDVPLVVLRGFGLGLSFPRWTQKAYRYRYGDAWHLDLKDKLSDFGAATVGGLDQVAKLVGFPGKLGVDGGMVSAMVAAGRRAEVDAYCLCDVAQTTAIGLRWKLLTGELTLEQYQEDGGILLEQIDAEPRLGELAGRIDREAFLLHDRVPSPLKRRTRFRQGQRVACAHADEHGVGYGDNGIVRWPVRAEALAGVQMVVMWDRGGSTHHTSDPEWLVSIEEPDVPVLVTGDRLG